MVAMVCTHGTANSGYTLRFDRQFSFSKYIEKRIRFEANLVINKACGMRPFGRHPVSSESAGFATTPNQRSVAKDAIPCMSYQINRTPFWFGGTRSALIVCFDHRDHFEKIQSWSELYQYIMIKNSLCFMSMRMVNVWIFFLLEALSSKTSIEKGSLEMTGQKRCRRPCLLRSLWA